MTCRCTVARVVAALASDQGTAHRILSLEDDGWLGARRRGVEPQLRHDEVRRLWRRRARRCLGRGRWFGCGRIRHRCRCTWLLCCLVGRRGCQSLSGPTSSASRRPSALDLGLPRSRHRHTLRPSHCTVQSQSGTPAERGDSRTHPVSVETTGRAARPVVPGVASATALRISAPLVPDGRLRAPLGHKCLESRRGELGGRETRPLTGPPHPLMAV